MKPIILASGSPARKALLEKIGLNFTVQPSNYDEDMTLDLTPLELAKHLSHGKAKSISKSNKNSIIIGADTIISIDNEILGKPHTIEKATEMLKKLNGKSHSVITGFTIIDTETNKSISKSFETKVHFKNLSEQEITSYIEKEMPLKNAGAYSIQDLGSLLTEKIDGSHSNVVGLPLSELADALKEFDIKIL